MHACVHIPEQLEWAAEKVFVAIMIVRARLACPRRPGGGDSLGRRCHSGKGGARKGGALCAYRADGIGDIFLFTKDVSTGATRTLSFAFCVWAYESSGTAAVVAFHTQSLLKV